MNKLDAQRQKEIQQAEELLFAGPQALGFAKGLFQGHFVSDWVMPYPRIPEAQQAELDQTLTELRKFLNADLDPAEIDRQADIPRSVIDGLGRVGVLGMTAPKEYGGHGFSQMANCKVLEESGRRCASTSVFVNAHHSIGIRALLLLGTATGRFALRDVKVPKENILGPIGKGLKVALTVLDFGRTTFGACCTGAAKTCLELAVAHANTRRQFDKTLGEFELVKKKIARIAADAYAMEAMTTVTAAFIDRGLEDYMLETAMLKVFTTERLWECINDVFQIYGGSAYFLDLPLERMLRDARINQIGEGANEVLTSFIALVGMRGPGMEFKEIYDTMMKPSRDRMSKAWAAGKSRLGATIRVPDVPVQSEQLRGHARQLGRLIWRFNFAVNRALITYREPILDMQLVQQRIANAAMDLFASTCVLSRKDSEIQFGRRNCDAAAPDHSAADLFLRQSFRRIRGFLAGLTDNDDKSVLATADSCLATPRS